MIPGGKITGPTPNLVNRSSVVAEKVANIAVPASASSVWDKLGAKSNTAPMMSGGFATSTPGTYGTSKLMSMSTQLADNSRYKLNLPNLANKPVQQGIGTSMQEVAGGKGSGLNKGNTVYVDDKNWPVTLKEIIGSRMLTQEQLEKASIANVKKLISVGKPQYVRNSLENSNGSKEENEELYYMFQRMMLEGFIRGVDITKEIKAQGGLDISIKQAPLAANPRNIGLSQTRTGIDQVGFNSKFWRGANEQERYQLFMHEVGHNLLNRGHAADEGDIMKSGGTVRNAKYLMKSKDAYNSMLNEHFSSATNKGTIAIAKQQAGQGTSNFDPSWFPQLSGEQVAIGNDKPYSPDSADNDNTPTGPDYSSNFSDINSNFARLTDILAKQSETMANMQEQQSIMNVDTSQAPVQGTINTSFGGGGGATATAAAPNVIGSSIDTTGFAQQLASLTSGGSAGMGGALLSSG